MKGQDPLALAIFGAALALLAGLLLYVFFFRAPEAAPRGPGLVEQARQIVDNLRKPEAQPQPRPKAQPRPQPQQAKTGPKPAPAGANVTLPVGHSWRYAVEVQPPVWRDVTLTYRTQNEAGGIGVLTDFVHAGGKMNFHLGSFAAGHPTHANTRFPGFFMYAAYLKQPLKVGDPVAFGWHWQGKSPRSVKRFEGQVKSWEDVVVRGRTYQAALIEGMWSYLEDGEFRARAYEKFWYAPQVSQVVKIMRFGIAPDEGSKQIDAELVEFR